MRGPCSRPRPACRAAFGVPRSKAGHFLFGQALKLAGQGLGETALGAPEMRQGANPRDMVLAKRGTVPNQDKELRVAAAPMVRPEVTPKA